ncbi:hypothetical protein RHMOL_Rhmol03G0244100 [Rhododendron molle]|uniref:Uncharacterized protein n=1 Tax=Rhododendron molle TaxID=49168 RepID=A0ACC0PJB7_RHOML|nr:hypothetical protein RHMOL_Rhmol03G0244100 [Rhododendron molle]
MKFQPIKVEGRIVACEGDNNPSLGHPIEFICLDLDQPAVCKYCDLRYLQDRGHHHHWESTDESSPGMIGKMRVNDVF